MSDESSRHFFDDAPSHKFGERGQILDAAGVARIPEPEQAPAPPPPQPSPADARP